MEKTTALVKEYGVEMRFLDFQSHLFDVSNANKLALAETIAAIEPDTAFFSVFRVKYQVARPFT